MGGGSGYKRVPSSEPLAPAAGGASGGSSVRRNSSLDPEIQLSALPVSTSAVDLDSGGSKRDA